MRFFSRRHRGSQTEAPTPVYRMRSVSSGTPEQRARDMAAAFAPPPLPKLRPLTSLDPRTARQALTASLRKADFLAEGHVQALADGILLDLEEHGLEIVASGEVE